MKKLVISFVLAGSIGVSSFAAVYINEILPNAPGGDTGNEYIELRGTPGFSLTNHYLLGLEGQGTGTPGKGDINQFFDLGSFSLGANGYLFIRQANSKYTETDPAANVIENTSGTGFGQANTATGSTVGHYSDSAQVDLENGATTFLLINIGTGIAPTNTMDLDTDNDGLLDLPEGWIVVDSVGIMDGSGAAETDASYGAITFKVVDQPGSSAYSNIVDVPGPMTTTAGTFYVGRKGESTGSTANDWVGGILNGSAAAPLDFFFHTASDPTFQGRLVKEMIFGGTNGVSDPADVVPFTPTLHSTRFTNYTKVSIGGTIGAVAVDPRDKTTILFTVDATLGGIFRATKVASGNWAVDPVPVVPNLSGPSGLIVQTNGTIWWVHDGSMSLMRLKAPWDSNAPEMVVTNFGLAATDDDPIDVAITPANFTGTTGKPNWLVIADRGSDGDDFNAVYLFNPATEELFQTNATYLVPPSTSDLGFGNLNAIAALPASDEVVTLGATAGYLSAINAEALIRPIIPTTLWPIGSTPQAAGMAVDPTTGRVWVSDDALDEIWSIDPAATGQTPDQKEISFPLTDPTKSYRQIDLHDPGMAFSPDGSFLVVSDSSVSGGGGRLIIFHREPFQVATFKITSSVKTQQGIALEWESAGPVQYSVRKGSDLSNLAGFSTIASNLTTSSFTDTNVTGSAAFYQVIANP